MQTEGLKRQFNDAFDILDAAIGSFDEGQWRSGSPPFDGPGRAVAHVLQCAEFYTCQDKAVFENFGKRVSEMSDEELPSAERMLEYAREARGMTLAWIDSVSDDALEQIVYAVRHLQHHIGEICAYQKQHGLEPAPWK